MLTGFSNLILNSKKHLNDEINTLEYRHSPESDTFPFLIHLLYKYDSTIFRHWKLCDIDKQ